MIRDVAAQNITLDTMLGANRAASMPASFDLALFDGDPNGTGTELDSTGGYVRVAVANDGTRWPDAAANGEKLSTPISLVGTDTYGSEATHWCLFDGTVGWFTGQLSEAVSEPTDTVTLSIFFGDDI